MNGWAGSTRPARAHSRSNDRTRALPTKICDNDTLCGQTLLGRMSWVPSRIDRRFIAKYPGRRGDPKKKILIVNCNSILIRDLPISIIAKCTCHCVNGDEEFCIICQVQPPQTSRSRMLEQRLDAGRPLAREPKPVEPQNTEMPTILRREKDQVCQNVWHFATSSMPCSLRPDTPPSPGRAFGAQLRSPN